ncbi:MAG: hypothetical protein OSB38_38650, partial [Paraburkholderia fungorum]|nr:hypothetical protein [Paraburkholderia fungorum]
SSIVNGAPAFHAIAALVFNFHFLRNSNVYRQETRPLPLFSLDVAGQKAVELICLRRIQNIASGRLLCPDPADAGVTRPHAAIR